MTGLAQVLGAATGSVLLLVAVTAVAVVLSRGHPIRPARETLLRVAQQPLTARTEPGETEAEAAATDQPQPQRLPEPSAPPADLSTSQLCRAWQHTHFALLDLPAGAPFDHIVRLRAQLLDEIETPMGPDDPAFPDARNSPPRPRDLESSRTSQRARQWTPLRARYNS